MENLLLKKRILEISYKKKLSHLGSCLTAVDIIKEIYDIKKPEEKFVLSCGHAGLALYVVLESKGGRNAEEIFSHHGVHPDRCLGCGIDFSTGSLGHGLPAAVGMALADRSKNVYCLISDGECSEGSVFEALRIAKEQRLVNLNVYVNVNGWGAYRAIDRFVLSEQLAPYQIISSEKKDGIDKRLVTIVHTDIPEWLQGQDGHYKVLTKEEYETYIR